MKIASSLVMSMAVLCTDVGNAESVHIVVKNDALVDLTGGSTIELLGEARYVQDDERNRTVAEFTNMCFRVSGPSISLAEDFTICFWMKGSGAEDWPVLVSNRPWENIKMGFTLGGRNKTALLSLGNTSRFLTPVNEGAPVIFDNRWRHLAFTYSREAGSKLYLDSNLIGQGPSLGSLENQPLTFLSASDQNYPTAGALDDIRVTGRVLSLNEIAEINGIEPVRIEYSDISPWPTWMRDKERSGYTPEEIDPALVLSWKINADHPPAAAWPDPAPHDFFNKRYNLQPRVIYDRSFHLMAAEQNVYYGSSADDSLTCRDAKTGRKKWKFHAEGPVRLAPTWHNGKIYFGSDDGYVYCLDAKTGALAWKTEAAESQKIAGNERIISLFPIRSSILIHKGKGFFGAGLFPRQGIYYSSIDLETGKILATAKIDTPAQGYLKVRGESVFTPTGRTGGAWLDNLQREGTSAARNAAVTTEYPFAAVGNAAYVARGGDGKVALFDRGSGEMLWSKKVQGRAYSVIIAYQSLYVSTDEGAIYCFGTEESSVDVTHSNVQSPIASEISSPRLKKIMDGRANRNGYALFVGAQHVQLAAELTKNSEMKAIVYLPKEHGKIDWASVSSLANRLHFHAGSLESLPYGPYLFNIVMADESVSRAEVVRVLNPYDGHGLHGGSVIPGKPIEDAGEWTHFYGDIGNTACSGDKNITSDDLALQWFGRPGPKNMMDRHNRTSAPLYRNGVMVISGMDWFTGVDAYNGAVLWEKTVKGSMRPSAAKSAGNMALDQEHLYIAAGNKCLVLEPRSGKQVYEYSLPDGAGDWCYVANYKGLLLGSECGASATRWGINSKSWDIAYSKDTPYVCSRSLFSFDTNNRSKKTRYTPDNGVIVTQTISVNNDRITFVENVGPGIVKEFEKTNGRIKLASLIDKAGYLVALDYATMNVLWRKPLDINLKMSMYSMAANDKTMIYGSFFDPTEREPFKVDETINNRRVTYDHTTIINYEIHCYDNGTGKKLWTYRFRPHEQLHNGGHGELTQHGAVIGNEMFLGNVAVNLDTGRTP